jgi:hypothetical protein
MSMDFHFTQREGIIPFVFGITVLFFLFEWPIAEIDAVREMKEKYCSVRPYSSTSDEIVSQSDEKDIYTLPDGQQVTIGDERCEAPEVLFRPSSRGIYYPCY